MQLQNRMDIIRRVRRVVFTQFSDLLLTPEDRMRDYYRRSYARMSGYYYPKHFMEIPYWIPILCSMLAPDRFERQLMIVDDISAAEQAGRAADDDEAYFMSVLDANLEYVLRLAETGAQLILGGYTDARQFDKYPNVRYLDEPADILQTIPGSKAVSTLDYSLFSGLECIPRYSLSSGCSFKCAFCTVPSKLVLSSDDSLEAEAYALRDLCFKLVFMDDKSFGEAPNWQKLGSVGARIRRYNVDFDGFIVQTPPSLACRPGFLEKCRDLGVRYVEFGVETVDDKLLKYLKKPFRVRHLMQACEIARSLDMYVIPNLIIGIPGDNYAGTTSWLSDNVDIIPVVNVNWLSLHFGNVRGDLGLPMHGVHDRDQNSSTKSWLTTEEEAAGWDMIDHAYRLTDQYWTGRMTYSDVTAR